MDDALDEKVASRLKFDVRGKPNLAFFTVGMDKKLQMREIPSDLTKQAFLAYEEDINGFMLSARVLAVIPEEFRVWGHIYEDILKRNISIDEYLSHDTFALFHQGIFIYI